MAHPKMTPVEIDQSGVEIHTVDGVFLKQYSISLAGTVLPQHAHQWSHLTMLACGALRVWKDGVHFGYFRAPCGIEIESGVKHAFETLEPDTVLWCIHNLHSADKVAILAEHELEF